MKHSDLVFQFLTDLFGSSIKNDKPCVSIVDVQKMLQGLLSIVMKGFSNNQGLEVLPLHDILNTFMSTLIDGEKSITVRLKSLLACHIILCDLTTGGKFGNIFVNWNGYNRYFIVQNSSKPDSLVSIYQMYLKKLALNYELIRRTKLKNLPKFSSKKIQHKLDPIVDQISQFNLINLINFAVSNFISTDTKIKGQSTRLNLAYEIYTLVWNDLLAAYLHLESIVIHYLDIHRQLDQCSLEHLYLIMGEFNTLTTKLQHFSRIQIFKKREIHIPQWKIIKQLEFLKVHRHIVDIKLLKPKQQKRTSSLINISNNQNHNVNVSSHKISIQTNTSIGGESFYNLYGKVPRFRCIDQF